MAFSSSGTPISMKEHSLGVSIGPGVSVGAASAGYPTFNTSSHNFQGAGEFSQQQREFLAQRNMMSQAVEQHPQSHGQIAGHSQGQHINMNEGAKVSTVSTHDFLSLYADNSNQYAEHHDNSRGLSSALTTKDFLQPLERGNHAAFREGQPARGEKHPRQQDALPHGSSAPPPAVVERLLTSGMGVYNGGHGVPNYGRVSKGGIDLPSNAMVRMVSEGNVEMRGRGFNPAAGPMLPREEHDTRSDLPKDQDPAVRGDNLAYWSNVRLKFGMLPPELGFHAPSQATSHNVMDSVQQPPVPNMPKQWAQGVQGVIDMTKRPIRVLSEDDEDDEEEYGDRPRETRKEPFPKADPAQKPEGKAPENRGGTPRSKHSATEQRRRSKINDRFQMLRELVPHSDQKRDKASFLLEVIEYIQVLQDKVRKFEAAEHGRHQDRLKTMVWDLCKRNGSGPGDSSIEATCMDALAYAKEFAPSSVSVLPVDVNQVTEAADAGRQRAVCSADENGSSELLPNNAQHTHKTGHLGASSSKEEKEGGAGLGKPVLCSQQNQVPTSYNSRNISHSSQSKQPNAAADAQANLTSEGQGHNSSPSAPSTVSFEQRDKPNEAEPSQQTRTQASSQQSHGEGDTTEQQHSDTRHRHGSSTAEDTGNGHASSFDDEQSKSNSKQERHHASGSPRAAHNSQAIDSSQANWQGQQHGNSTENAQQREESRGGTTSPQGQDPLTIQGGVINVSSVYSQGLLDTLTRALQSSGLDLSQANISVQIDLGKSISSASLPPSAPKVSGQQSEPSGQRHQQFEGLSRQQGGSCTDPEHPPLKRPKLEMEL